MAHQPSVQKNPKTQDIAEDFQEVKLQLKFSTVWPSFSDFQPIIQLGKLFENNFSSLLRVNYDFEELFSV